MPFAPLPNESIGDDGEVRLASRRAHSVERGARRLRPGDVLSEDEWASIMRTLRLSSREGELIWHAFHGRSITEMAQALGISAHTIHTYRDRLYRKLGARSLSEVVAIVFATYVTLSASERGDRRSRAVDSAPSCGGAAGRGAANRRTTAARDGDVPR